MRDLVRVLRQRLVMEGARRVGVETEIELILPAEVESPARTRVVAQMRGDVVYNPDATAPDGTKGTYRFAFQPSDAYSFKDIALAYELLVSSMPMLTNNLLYYPFPQAALPLYQKERALYDAYRVPVLLT